MSPGYEETEALPLTPVSESIGVSADDAINDRATSNSPQKWPSPSEPMKVARKFAMRQRVDGVTIIRRWRGDWFNWKVSHWELAEDAAIRKTLYSTLEEAVYINAAGDLKPWAPTRHKIANLTEALGAVTYLAEGIHPPAWEPAWYGPSAHNLVSVNNGILSVRDRVLIGHDPHFFNLVSVPFDYVPAAKDPQQWLNFLDQLWPDDPESIAALQQFFGYVLSGRIDLHKILLLVGPTRAGKGVVARILTALIGHRNVAGPTLSGLGTNFGLQPLIGKPLAIISDARLGASAGVSVVVERLLSISGEDRLTIDRKYKEPWTGKLNTRFMVISNELPRLGDASGAIANRFVVLVLRRSWLGDENTKLTDQLLEELPGILNWALAGIDSLNAHGSFIEPENSREAIAALQDLTSPVSAFVRDDCVLGAEHEISKDDLFRGWVAWRERNGWSRPGTKATFGRDLLAAYPMVHSVRPREDDQRANVYRGIDLKQHWPVSPTTLDQNAENQAVGDGQGDQEMSSHNNRGRDHSRSSVR